MDNRTTDLSTMTENHKKHLAGLRLKLETAGCDAFLLHQEETLRYYTGYTGDSAYLFLDETQTVFFTDGRYLTQAANEIPADINIVPIKAFDDLTGYLKDQHINHLGVDVETLPTRKWLDLRPVLSGREPKSAGDYFKQLRICKDEYELHLISEAIAISETALRQTLARLKPGIIERDLALELEYRMRRAGAEALAFPLIVASGPRSALPHGLAADRILQAGDIVTIDFGARYKGYHSDQTCTFFLGEPAPDIIKVYQTLYQAQSQGISKAAVGLTAAELDREVREILAAAGLGENFAHGTGPVSYTHLTLPTN